MVKNVNHAELNINIATVFLNTQTLKMISGLASSFKKG